MTINVKNTAPKWILITIFLCMLQYRQPTVVKTFIL